MHVISLEIQNYLRVDAFEVTPEGKHVIISARNGEGKTSIVNALFEGLRGMSMKDRPEPVHHGAEKAYIKIDLGEYIVEKHINAEGKPRLVVTASDGTKVASPQKILDGLLNAYSLDPVAFLHQRPQDQLDDVLKICGVKPPVDTVKVITGKPYPARAGESADQYMSRLSADDTGLIYLERRDANRDVDICRGAVQKQKDMLDGMKSSTPTVRPAETILAEITALEKEQEAYHECRRTISELEATEREALTLMADLKRDRDITKGHIVDSEKRIIDAQTEILRLQSLVDKEQEANRGRALHLKTIEGRIAKGQEVLDQHAKKIQHERDSSVPDQSKKIEALRSEWKAANAQSEQVIKQQQAESRLTELEADLVKAKRSHDHLDKVLTQLRQLRKDLLNGADFGVNGLSVGEGELLLHGVPFIQASQAQKLRVAAAVAMKQDAHLKLLRIDNGEMLDATSQKYLLDLASENGWQVIMTRVSNDKQLQVQIVDGEVSKEGDDDDGDLVPRRRGKKQNGAVRLADKRRNQIGE